MSEKKTPLGRNKIKIADTGEVLTFATLWPSKFAGLFNGSILKTGDERRSPNAQYNEIDFMEAAKLIYSGEAYWNFYQHKPKDAGDSFEFPDV